MHQIYLDHAAATPLDGRVLAAMRPYFSDRFYNPSAMYGAARQVRADIETARASIARHFGARPAEIIFTAGGTEANNLAISGIMGEYTDARMITSAIEHDSILEPARYYDHELIGAGEDGVVDTRAVEAAIDDRTVLVSIMYANNEIGTIQPIREIGQMLSEVRQDRRRRGVKLPLYFHSDAAQAGNYLDLHVARLGVDLLSLNGGKIYGPKQSGLLYVRAGVALAPLIRGGGQESGLRSGTENVPGIIGLAAALDIACAMKGDESRRMSGLQAYVLVQLADQLPEAKINGSIKRRLPNNIHLTIPGQDNERLLFRLDERGIEAAAGSACSASSRTASHVLRAIGRSDSDARSSLRLTMGRTTDQESMGRAIETLRRLVRGDR